MINKYNEIVDNIVFEFIKKLYIEENIGEVPTRDDYRFMDYNRVLSGPIEVFDRYLPLDDILICLANGFTAKSLVAYTDYALDLSMNGKECKYNYYNYTKYINNPDEFEKEKQENLEKSEKNLKEVENSFKSLISNLK